MNPVILSGGEIGLGVVRSLGMMNIKSILIYCHNDEFARVSKHVKKAYKCPNWSDSEAVINFFIKKKDDLKSGMLIPAGDRQVEVLAKYKKELSKCYLVPVPDYEIAKLFLDKKETYIIAKKAGINYPQTFYPNSMEEALANTSEMQFPLLIKPREYHKFFPVFKKKLFIVNNNLDLKKNLKLCFDHNLKIMITEIIPGSDDHFYEYDFYVDKSGELTAGLTQVKLRQHPPNFGFARVLKTTVNKEVEKLTRMFLKQIPEFFGPGQLEFKLDPRDKKYKLIEMNGRMTFQTELYAKAGINFPYLFYQDWIYNNSKTKNNYIEDLYWVHLIYDLMDSILRHNEENYSFVDYFRPYLKKHMYGIESLSDPMPMIIFWSQKVKNLSKFIRKNKY